MGFHKWDDFPRRTNIRKGTWRRVVATENLTAQRGEMEPGTEFDGGVHRHPEDQIIVVMKGKMRLHIDGEEGWLEPGDVGVIPGGEFHGGVDVGPEGAEYLEIIAGGRMDYLPGYVGPPKNEFKGPGE